jgi:hypothetical protein
MKTSSKLIIAFGGWIFAMLLFSAIILRVNYSRGTTNNTPPSVPESSPPEAIKPFKVLVIKETNKNETTHLTLLQNGKSEARGLSKHEYSFNGDTLFLQNTAKSYITLYCKELEYIEFQGKKWQLDIFDLKQPGLNISASEGTYTYINNTDIRFITYDGQPTSALYIRDNNKIDSADLTLRKNGKLTFEATNKYSNIKVDSLEELHLGGNALNSIKSIK